MKAIAAQSPGLNLTDLDGEAKKLYKKLAPEASYVIRDTRSIV